MAKICTTDKIKTDRTEIEKVTNNKYLGQPTARSFDENKSGMKRFWTDVFP